MRTHTLLLHLNYPLYISLARSGIQFGNGLQCLPAFLVHIITHIHSGNTGLVLRKLRITSALRLMGMKSESYHPVAVLFGLVHARGRRSGFGHLVEHVGGATKDGLIHELKFYDVTRQGGQMVNETGHLLQHDHRLVKRRG